MLVQESHSIAMFATHCLRESTSHVYILCTYNNIIHHFLEKCLCDMWCNKVEHYNGFSVSRSGGRPSVTTHKAGSNVSDGRPRDTTREAGSNVSNGRPCGTTSEAGCK